MTHFRRVMYNNETKQLDPSETHMKLFGDLPNKPFSNGMEFVSPAGDHMSIDGVLYPIYP